MILRISFLPLVALIGACSDADRGERGDAAATAVIDESHVIPVEYRGRWAETPAACLSDNSRRYEISAAQIYRADFSARVEDVIIAGDTANVSLEGQGGAAQFRFVLDDANTMRASYGTRAEFTLRRCR